MPPISQVRFRSDLVITETQTVGDRTKSYFIKNPSSGDSFLLGEEELYLCRAINGQAMAARIIEDFSNTYQKVLSEEDLHEFVEYIHELGFLEPVPQSGGVANRAVSATASPLTATTSRQQTIADPDLLLQPDGAAFDDEVHSYRLFSINPESGFSLLATLCRPFRLFILALVLCLIPAVPVAGYLFWKYDALLFRDILALKSQLSILMSFLLTLLLVNLVSRLISGTVFTSLGGRVTEMGLHLRFGLIPRFYIRRFGIRQHSRYTQLWAYAAAPLFRLALFNGSLLFWYMIRSSGTQLVGLTALLSQVGLVGLLLVSLPIRKSEGFKWATTYFNQPTNLISRSLSLLWMTLLRQPIPSRISKREKWLAIGYSTLLIVSWTFFFYIVVSRITHGLTQIFPGVAGRATPFLLGSIVTVLFFRWLFLKFFPDEGGTGAGNRAADRAYSSIYSELSPVATSDRLAASNALKPSKVSSHHRIPLLLKLLILFGLGVLLVLPFPYQPGGSVEIVPPHQQAIQVPIQGRVTEVFVVGGDGQLTPAGTNIASITSDAIINQINSIQESIRSQQAEVAIRQAELSQVAQGPRAEEVSVAQADVATAQSELAAAEANYRTQQQQVAVAQSQLDAALSNAKYSAAEVERMSVLYEEGGFALTQLEEAKRQAEINRIQIDEMNQSLLVVQANVATAAQAVGIERSNLEKARAQLNLLMSGAPEQDVETAQQAVNSAQAELRRLQNDLSYAQNQQQSTLLKMPFNGYLEDAFLAQKVGMYLQPGATFAIANVADPFLGKMQLSEYEVEDIELDAPVTIKLVGYPTEPIMGQVQSIEPTTSNEIEDPALATTRTFDVLIRMNPEQQSLKAGMTGYGKIDAGKKPLIVLLTQPIVRFVQLEVWSWLP